MQDPNSMDGALLPVPDNDLTKVPKGWNVYHVGQKIRMNGFMWEVTEITDGLKLVPVRKISFGEGRNEEPTKADFDGLRKDVQKLEDDKNHESVLGELMKAGRDERG